MYDFDATLHISYKEVNGNLIQYLEDSHTLVSKHIPKADAIYDNLIVDRQRNVFWTFLPNYWKRRAASPYQFFVTDSSTHFLKRCSLF